MKGQIEFFTDVLGMRLVALYWMHGAVGAWHAFLELNESSTLAFVFIPGNEKVLATPEAVIVARVGDEHPPKR